VLRHSLKKLQAFIVLFLASTIFTSTSFFSSNSFAYASPTTTTHLLVSPLTYVASTLGETFKIDVNVFNVENLHAFELKLSYNTTLLDVAQVVQGAFFPPPPESSIDKLEINETRGSVWFGMSLSDSTPSKSGNGTLASITFNVTFAPLLPTKACCVLDLHETILYDNTMTGIAHYLTDGLYFWKSMFNDPDGVLILDLTTQKDGTGIGEPSPPFTLGEMVELRVRLTYDDVPEVNNLVGFEVINPNNEIVMIRAVWTDSNGVATIEFGIPSFPVLPKNIGTWKAFASSEVKGKFAWDILYFTVTVAVGGDIALIEKTSLPPSQVDLFPVILPLVMIATLLAVIAYRRRHWIVS